MGVQGWHPRKFFWKYRCKSVQFRTVLATSATENVQLSVFNLGFGRWIWWYQVIKIRVTENSVHRIYRPCCRGSVAPGCDHELLWKFTQFMWHLNVEPWKDDRKWSWWKRIRFCSYPPINGKMSVGADDLTWCIHLTWKIKAKKKQ